MEMALVRANIEEETEDTMTHFLNGLNPDIRDVVELHEYVELDDLLHKAVCHRQGMEMTLFLLRLTGSQKWHISYHAQIAKKIESYTKQANKNRKKVVLEPGGDSEDLRANVFQEVGNDENPKAAQIQRLWAF
ncbi:uncharacterized protein LOC114373127 [Glycine soja]|uniref:uncharacterized protein LOC114373127 n=1 Tax=Glycine soja TaxID=3848 RepID=UPI00103B56D8|nr:uncharacterized protein LOC114373127 [Glycine soja]